MPERATDPSATPPPVAPQRTHTWKRPTGDHDDPYAWMLDVTDKEFLNYLEAENDYAQSWFDANAILTATIVEEIRSRVQETDQSPAVRAGSWWYSSRTVEGLSYPIHCRAASRDEAETDAAQVVLDQNIEAEGHDFFDLGAFEPDHQHNYIAWSADTAGNEHYTLRIRDTTTGLDLDDSIPDTTWGGVAWSAGAEYLFYVVADDTERPYQVRRHQVGSPTTNDQVVFTDLDERFYVGIELTRSGRFIIIHSGSKTSTEIHLLDALTPLADPICVRPRVENVEYSVDDWGEALVITTNLDAEDFCIMTAAHDDPAKWAPFIGHESGRRITAAEPFNGVLAVHEWVAAQPRIRLIDTNGTSRLIELADQPHDIEFGPNETFDTTTLRVRVQSLTQPSTIIDVNLADLSQEVIRQTPTPGVDLDDYISERHWATADDGTEVPYDIVRHKDHSGALPAVMYAYGSYEISLPPWFSVARLSLLDRGFAWVLVHPRGGGELGRQWYLNGKFLNKRNTFTDVIAATHDATSRGFIDGQQLGIRGGSAGGLMVGACITMEPELFTSAVAEVPFVDVVSTMSDPSLPLTVTEWEEWGDPRAEPYASYIESYSPYDNTLPANYPALLITAGLNDPRVSVHEPAKWTARLRSVRTNNATLLFKTEMGAGHGGPSGRYAAWEDEAKTLTFLIQTLCGDV